MDFYKSREWIEARKRYIWMPMIPQIAYVGGVYPFLQYTKMAGEVWVPYLKRAFMGELAPQTAVEQAQSTYERILREASKR